MTPGAFFNEPQSLMTDNDTREVVEYRSRVVQRGEVLHDPSRWSNATAQRSHKAHCHICDGAKCFSQSGPASEPPPLPR